MTLGPRETATILIALRVLQRAQEDAQDDLRDLFPDYLEAAGPEGEDLVPLEGDALDTLCAFIADTEPSGADLDYEEDDI